jgi:hypothetical protein
LPSSIVGDRAGMRISTGIFFVSSEAFRGFRVRSQIDVLHARDARPARNMEQRDLKRAAIHYSAAST